MLSLILQMLKLLFKKFQDKCEKVNVVMLSSINSKRILITKPFVPLRDFHFLCFPPFLQREIAYFFYMELLSRFDLNFPDLV